MATKSVSKSRKSRPAPAVAPQPNSEAILKAAEIQSLKALNLSGALEAFEMACREGKRPTELEAGLGLLKEEATRIYSALEREALLRAATAEAQQ